MAEILTPAQAATRLLLTEQNLTDLAAGLIKSDDGSPGRAIQGPPILQNGNYRAGDVEMFRNSPEYAAALRVLGG